MNQGTFAQRCRALWAAIRFIPTAYRQHLEWITNPPKLERQVWNDQVEEDKKMQKAAKRTRRVKAGTSA
jgi:hypothetical protein